MICEYCKQDKPEDRFEVCKRTENKVYRRNKCKDCRNKDKKERRSNIRKKIDEIKKKSSCNRCGFENYRALQFHHTESDKKFAVADATAGWGWQTIKEEINKCEIICANCHEIEHYG